jgi:hypothetical protein
MESTTSAGGGGEGGASFIPQSCPDGTYAVSYGDDGMLGCGPLDGDVAAAVDAGCSVYLGWRDGCSGCSSGPAKVGRVAGAACENLSGADNTCTQPTLGGDTVPMYGLNTDGDVDGNDMFYLGWYCPPTGETALFGPCEAGEHMVGVTPEGVVDCMPVSRVVADYVREHCSAYFGWRDNCNGCPDPPSKWGVQRGATCDIGAGVDNACGAELIDGQWVPQVGINTDGDVDDNDTFFVGLHCESGAADTVAVERSCPFGMFVTGFAEDGTIVCTSPDLDISPVVRDSCKLYWGYRDGCGGCTSAPDKWGATTTALCTPGQSASCVTHDLGGTMVNLVGIRTDGDVDGNDKFYVGLSCQ